MLKSRDVVLMTTGNKTVREGKLIKESRLSTGCDSTGWYSRLRLTHDEESITDEDDDSAELYVTSDETPKDGDWVISDEKLYRVHSSESWRIPMGMMIQEMGGHGFFKLKPADKLIIATTDERLFLPLVPETYVKRYISDYQRELWHGVNTIMVDYSKKGDLFVNVDKTISIKLEKKSFTPDQAMELAESYHDAIVGNLDETSCPIKSEKKVIEEWKHENLYETV